MIEEQVMVLQKQTINIEGGRAIWEQVNAIQQSMLEVQQAAKSVRIDPPTNDHWWNTVESKGETLGSLGTLAKEKLIPSSLEQATKQFNQSFALALMQQQNIKTQLDQAMKLLSKSFEDQKRQLGSLGEPFKWISLDLETTVTRFPILLALALATISWVGSQQLFELAYALYLQSLPEKLLWEWYFQRTSDWSKGIYLIRDGYLRLDLVLVGYLIWVTIAAIQTRTLPQVSYIAAGGMLLLAWTILIIAFWHRQKTWHQVMLLKSRTEVPLP
ncbi:MAG: hypothetical protein WC856_20710 [Methylococcaceae bacterium]|jgi:hypothetical protein